MEKTSIRNLIFILALCLAGVSCNNNPASVKNSETVTFTGKVENDGLLQTTIGQEGPQASLGKSSLSPVNGAVVTAATVNVNGDLSPFSKKQAKTNAEGEYTLKEDLSVIPDSVNQIVILAKSDGQTTKAYVDARGNSGKPIIVHPITVESSAQTAVYQQVVGYGFENEVTKADIEAAVGPDIAAVIEDNKQCSCNIAKALAAAYRAKAKLYAQNSIKMTGEQQQQIIETKQKAEDKLVNALNAAADANARQNAYHTFLKTIANAELNAGVKAWAVAESDDFAARVMHNKLTMFSSNAEDEIRKYAYFYTAVAVDSSAQSLAKTIGASENTVNAIADAGTTLKNSLLSTTNASAKVVSNAYLQFNKAVGTALKKDSSINGSAFTTSNSTINAAGGLKNTIESQLESAGDMDAMLGAYSDFYSGVKTIVKTNFAKASNTDVQAYTRLLVVINLAS